MSRFRPSCRARTCLIVVGKTVRKKFCWDTDGRKVTTNWDCLFVHRQQGLFLSVYVDDMKLDGKKLNLDLMWKKLMKHVDLEEPTSFLDHVYLGCTQRECKPKRRFG